MGSMGNKYVVRWLFCPRLVVEDRIREQLLESHNVFVGDVLVEVLIVEWPRSRPQSSKVPKWYWRNGVLLCHKVKDFWRVWKISFLGGKILFCKEPVAMDVSGAVGNVKASPSRCR